MKKYKGKYVGPREIKSVTKIKKTTLLGKPKVKVVYEQELLGKDSEILPLEIVDKTAMDGPIDWTALREERGKPVIEQVMVLLTEAELTKSEIEYIMGPKLVETINLAFSMANEKLWGKSYDNITMKDADEALKGEIEKPKV